MAVVALEGVLLFLVVPTIASGLAILAGWLTYSELRARGTIGERVDLGPRETKSIGLFVVYPAIVSTSVIFGFVLWVLGRPVAEAIDANTGNAGLLADRLYFWSGVAFAWVASVPVATEAWVARSRMVQFVGRDFGRTETLLVIPETAVILALILVFLVLGRLEGGPGALSEASVDSVVLGLQLFAVSSLALLVAASASGRVRALTGRGFLRALMPLEAGVGVTVVTFLWA